MKKLLGLGVITLSAITLTACSNSVDNSGKYNDADKSGKVVSSKKTTKNSQEVTNGPLLKVGQWTKDSQTGKLTLKKIATPKIDVANGPATFTVNDVKLFKDEINNNNQLEYSKSAFSASSLEKTFYYVQIDYTMKNTSAEEIQYDGINSIVTNDGTQIDMTGQLQDQGAGNRIAPNAKKQSLTLAIVKPDVTELKITFGGISQSSGDYTTLSEKSETATIALK
ncbi:hypothetical protein RIU76_06335 [Latilactobacillus sakei subsp. sakei]|uniref:hypothetical protein n=1 Tax=Latilactobacillus sakei TaxID=1599 RepID=UPI00285BDEA2|nr:hypothetical protein [Latilactobacillus sakei]MDR7924342.1 hypothetical protein [Latilactobacillus sakei subsp. sakei]